MTNKEKFTPRPWNVHTRIVISNEWSRCTVLSGTRPGRKMVCQMPDLVFLNDDSRKEADETIANGHLISAAPDMYDMLKNLKTLIKILSVGTCTPDKVVNEIEELLSKARGEE